jgi:hypothetical protein
MGGSHLCEEQRIVPGALWAANARARLRHKLRVFFREWRGGEFPSVITLKPAIRYHFKTGQRDWPKT